MNYTEEQAFNYLYSIHKYLKLSEINYLISNLLTANDLRLTLNHFYSKDITLYSLLGDSNIYYTLNTYYGVTKVNGKYILTYRAIVFILEYYGVLDNVPEIESQIAVTNIKSNYDEQEILINLRTKYNTLLDIVINLQIKKNELELQINDIESNLDKLLASIQILESVLK